MPGTPLETLLADAQALRESVGGDGDAMQLPVRLAGGVYNAVTRPMEDGRLFVVQSKAEPGASGGDQTGYEACIQLQTLVSVARAMRVPLTNLFGAADAVFPRLEELEEPGVQRQMSSINRALYQLMHLSCNIGDYSAAAAGEMRLLREKTELCDFLYGILERAEPLFAERPYKVRGILAAKVGMTYIKASRKPFAVKRIEVFYKFRGS